MRDEAGYDWDPHRRVMELREQYGDDRGFYWMRAWRHLRERILRDGHRECVDCLAKSPARYTEADTVHHVRFVEDWPGYALSEFVPDGMGGTERNLVPLCHDCHDLRHGRIKYRPSRGAAQPLTIERW